MSRRTGCAVALILSLIGLACTALCLFFLWDSLIIPHAVEALVVAPENPSTVYLGTKFGRVFTSTDGGERWNHVFTGPSAIYNLMVDPATPTTVVAQTVHGNYETTDGGTSWRLTVTPLPRMAVTVVESSKPNLLYEYTWSPYRSLSPIRDSGPGAAKMRLPKGYTLPVMVIDPVADGTAYVVTSNDGILKTINGGKEWSALRNDLCTREGCLDLRALAIDPRTPATLYIGGPRGVYKSSDSGERWRHLTFWVMPWD